MVIVYKSSTSFLWLVFLKNGVLINNFRFDTGKESVFLSYPDFEPYKKLLLKSKKQKAKL